MQSPDHVDYQFEILDGLDHLVHAVSVFPKTRKDQLANTRNFVTICYGVPQRPFPSLPGSRRFGSSGAPGSRSSSSGGILKENTVGTGPRRIELILTIVDEVLSTVQEGYDPWVHDPRSSGNVLGEQAHSSHHLH